MNNQEKLGIWKRKLVELKEKITKLEQDKNILITLLNEAEAKQNINFDNPLYETELQEKISYINDWIGFHSKGIEKYGNKLKEVGGKDRGGLKREIKEEDIENSFKFIFSEVKEEKSIAEIKALKAAAEEQPIERAKWAAKEKIINIRESVKLFKAQRPLVKYAIPFAVLLLIIVSLFLLKPSITGHVIFGKETAYNENLNLKINESGNYMWLVNKSGEIKSISASGSFSGNGTVKIYIQKDGKKYLIFDNKGLNNASTTS